MADTKISGLTAAASAVAANELAINEAGTSKKITLAQIETYLQTKGMPRVKRLGTSHDISSVTGTEVTDLTLALEAGTYTFKYSLAVRTWGAATDMPLLGVNFTGTASYVTMIARWADASGSLLAETHEMDDQGVLTSGFISGMANKALTTTSPNMGTSVGSSATNTPLPMFIEGILIVTASGNLALWHSSETASTTKIDVGSSLAVIRTA